MMSVSQVVNASHFRQAREKDGKLIENLETQLDCPPAQFVKWLAETLHMPAASLEELRQETPAFDLISYADASRRNCPGAKLAHSSRAVIALPGGTKPALAASIPITRAGV